MKTKLLKQGFKAFLSVAFLFFSTMTVTSTASAAKQGSQVSVTAQSRNQVAVQLGAIKLGLLKPGQTASQMTPVQLKAALTAGLLALNADALGNNPSAAIPSALLLEATLNALKFPVLAPSLGLDLTQVTPAQIVAVATQRNPQLAQALITAAVAATMSHTTDTQGIIHPVFGPQPTLPSGENGAAAVSALNSITEDQQVKNADLLQNNLINFVNSLSNTRQNSGNTGSQNSGDSGNSENSGTPGGGGGGVPGLGTFGLGNGGGSSSSTPTPTPTPTPAPVTSTTGA